MPTYRNARECLAAVAARYRAMETYTDNGIVRRIGSNGPDSCWFETAYAGQSRFRFEFSLPHPYRPLRHIVTKSIVGIDGHKPYYYTEHPRSGATVEAIESLQLAVAGATGVSQGTAHTIGSLLLECVQGFSLEELKRPRFRRSREFMGLECSVISGLHPRGGRVSFWFGINDLVVRKVIRHWAKCEEVRLNIRLNGAIPDAAFHIPAARI